MQAKEISQALKRVSNSLQRFHSLNSGGCGVVAAAVARELEEHGVRYEIVTNHDFADVDEARQNVSDPFDMGEWEQNGVYFGHVAVKVWLNERRAGIWDSEGFIPAESNTFPAFPELELARGSFTLEEMEAFIHQRSHWNAAFDRRQIPAVRRAIHEAFNQVEAMA